MGCQEMGCIYSESLCTREQEKLWKLVERCGLLQVDQPELMCHENV